MPQLATAPSAPAAGPITRDELARVMDAQDRAFQALVWLSTIAHSRPHLLTARSADELRDPVQCLGWLARHREQLPERVRPMADQEREFARLFAGFFQTSFRVERRLWDGRPYFVIATNADEAAGRQKLAARKFPYALRLKRRIQADRLLERAMAAAAGGDDPAAAAAAARMVVGLADESLRQSLLIWGYAAELVYRARGDPHGPAVHAIWKRMPVRVRTRLTADRAWKARERLAAAAVAVARLMDDPPVPSPGTPGEG